MKKPCMTLDLPLWLIFRVMLMDLKVTWHNLYLLEGGLQGHRVIHKEGEKLKEAAFQPSFKLDFVFYDLSHSLQLILVSDVCLSIVKRFKPGSAILSLFGWYLCCPPSGLIYYNCTVFGGE